MQHTPLRSIHSTHLYKRTTRSASIYLKIILKLSQCSRGTKCSIAHSSFLTMPLEMITRQKNHVRINSSSPTSARHSPHSRRNRRAFIQCKFPRSISSSTFARDRSIVPPSYSLSLSSVKKDRSRRSIHA